MSFLLVFVFPKVILTMFNSPPKTYSRDAAVPAPPPPALPPPPPPP